MTETTRSEAATAGLPTVYTPDEAAEILQCSSHYLVDKANSGEFPCLRLNNKALRFTSEHIMSIIRAYEHIPDGFGEVASESTGSDLADADADVPLSDEELKDMPGQNRRAKMRFAKMAGVG